MSDEAKAPDAGEAVGGWRKLLLNAAIAQIVVIVATMVVTMEVIPPLIVFALVLGGGIYLLARNPKAGGLMLGIVSLLHIALSAPFFIGALFHPDSFGDFSLAWLTVFACLLGIIAGVPVWRERGGDGQPRMLGRVAIGLTVVVLLLAGFSTLSRESEDAQEGDLLLVAEDVEFAPEELSGESGSLSVHIDNKDPFRHTFAVEDLDIEFELPAGKGTRVGFEAEPGEYEYICSVPGHEDMKGTLTVE